MFITNDLQCQNQNHPQLYSDDKFYYTAQTQDLIRADTNHLVAVSENCCANFNFSLPDHVGAIKQSPVIK